MNLDVAKPALVDGLSSSLARRSLIDYCKRMDGRFLAAQHLVLIASYLERLERREIRKLAVTMPPRHGKTRLVSQFFSSWYLGRHPDHDIILASYGSELAEGNSRAVRTLVTDERFPFAGVTLREDSRSVGRWQTEQGSTLVAAGLGGSLTGRGFSLCVADDLVKGREEAESDLVRASTKVWFEDVLSTRAAPDAVQVMVGTRWHEADILSEVIRRDGWEILNLPLISEGEGDQLCRAEGVWLWPERFGPEDVPSVERGEISSRSFAALFQQRPSGAQGNIFRRSFFDNRYDELPKTTRYSRVQENWRSRNIYERIEEELPLVTVMAADCAAKTGIANDFSAIVVIATDGSSIYLVDVVRERLEFADLALSRPR